MRCSPGTEAWRIKVRVARLWIVQTFMKPDQINSLEMVLIDEKVCFIHSSDLEMSIFFVCLFGFVGICEPIFESVCINVCLGWKNSCRCS